ncbi:MAG: DegT/DnrJ/EryC1/StrS aminotransferase family protein [Nitrospirae bacterium]|nr:DegT/DnrJ/EryC1/StrS aminotransferase family protein [Nitrospirota bacterium]
MKRVEFFRHNIEDEDIKRVEDILRSIFLTTGSAVLEFEQKFSSYTDLQHTIAVTSCTAALHLSLLAHNIGEGDEVITTPMSFCATANSIIHAGARPVFVDVERDTGNLNAELIEAAITEKTKAILPVHLYGQMCDMKKIREIADRHKLVVIEDAAHAIEAERDGIKVGQIADTACFSFYATKNITSGEGGAVCTNRAETADLLRMLRLHGIDKSAIDRYTKRFQHWDMPVLGWKYNMDNIHAALLIGQVERLDELWRKRDRLWNLYEEGLTGVKGLDILRTVKGARHARHLFTILVDPEKRDSILWSLQEKEIGVAVNYRPIHLLKYYRETFGYKEGDFPVAEEIGCRTISLPLYPKLSEDEAQHVIRIVREVVEHHPSKTVHQ